MRIIANFFFFEFETALNQNIKSARRRGEGSVLGGVAVFSRSRFSVWKELSQLQGSLRRALLHWTEGTRREAGRSECWEAAQKKKDALFSLSFLLLCCLHLSLSSPPALCPSAQAAEKPSLPSCAGIRMFLGDRQISGLAPVQRERGLVVRIHTLKRYSSEMIHKETRGENVRLFGCFHKKKQKKKGENPFRNTEKIKSSYCSEGKRAFYRILFHVFIIFVNIAVMHIIR